MECRICTTVDRTLYKHTSKGVKNASVISTNVYFCALQNVSNYVSWISIYIICTYTYCTCVCMYIYIHTYIFIYLYIYALYIRICISFSLIIRYVKYTWRSQFIAKTYYQTIAYIITEHFFMSFVCEELKNNIIKE